MTTNEAIAILKGPKPGNEYHAVDWEAVDVLIEHARNSIPKPTVEVEHSTRGCRVRVNGIAVYSDFDDDGFCSMLAAAIRAALGLEAKKS